MSDVTSVRALVRRFSEPISTLRRILPLLWASAPRSTLAASALMLVEIAAGLAVLFLIKELVDVLTGMLGPDAPDGGLQAALLYVALTGAATVLYVAARALAGPAREAKGMAVADHVDGLIHTAAVRADLSFHESPKYFDTLQRARQAGPQRPAQVGGNVLMLGKNLVMLVAVVALMVTINVWLLPLLAVVIVPALLVRLLFTRILYEWKRRHTQLEGRAGYLDFLMTSDYHANELRLNQLGAYLRELYRGIRGSIRREQLGISRRRTLVELLAASVATIAFFLVAGRLSGTLAHRLQVLQSGAHGQASLSRCHRDLR